jgi:hypothetical protein
MIKNVAIVILLHCVSEKRLTEYCYIEKFSLRDYRLTRNMDAREQVVIKGFTARGALFGGDASLDFSNALIEGAEFSLEGFVGLFLMSYFTVAFVRKILR